MSKQPQKPSLFPLHYTTDKASHFSYDSDGRLQVQVDPLGQQTQYMYDPLDRVVATQDTSDAMLVYAYTKHHCQVLS